MTEFVFNSSALAAWVLDGKSEYINVEFPVKTTKGTFFFVQNTEAPAVNQEHTTLSSLKPFSGEGNLKL
jgi:hypothetical protein